MQFFKKYLLFLFIIGFSFPIHSQKNIKLNGLVVDENNEPIPYAAIGIPSKSLGTATTEEGTFLLFVSKNNLSDFLEVSSIGFETFKIKVQDFINLKEKKIVIKEAVMSLDEIVLSKKPKDYAKLAIKKLWKTTINDEHQLNILYRRFSVEEGKARFLVEHYINVLDKGPLEGKFLGVEIVAARKSADYRFVKKKLKGHPINVITRFSPLRNDFRLIDYNWKRKGDTSYDGEDVLIVEGRFKGNNRRFVRLYVGMDTYGVYRVETSILSALYVYKKDADGKLHLSYHNRTRNGKVFINSKQKAILGTDKEFVNESYKHEVFVLGVKKDSKTINASEYKTFNEDIGDIKANYNASFWENFSLPPATKFYKKSVKELEAIYGVSLKDQFKAVNK